MIAFWAMKTTVRQTVRRLLDNFKVMGDAAQRAEAEEIEHLLEQQPEAVSFATADDDQSKGEGKKS